MLNREPISNGEGGSPKDLVRGSKFDLSWRARTSSLNRAILIVLVAAGTTIALDKILSLNEASQKPSIDVENAPPKWVSPELGDCSYRHIASSYYVTGPEFNLDQSLQRLRELCQPTGDNPPISVGQCINGAQVVAEIEVRDQGRRISAIPITDGRFPC
jgi:hypothetical protein